ncbi:AAA family ATPase [Nocardioides anomalus]|uniref:AAA family ATPase n=1 Tax=Nocardioides anomalus TaxID=2712223 RepID=A0A6G6WGI5_9ACTN|nr:BTAD domain-containing putative transcriptional regulator [Nocardioides anomalus]QIG44267.1 AAA family ATPase [Nocardioides anomalus]
MDVRVEVLGPLRVLVDGRPVELGPARRRALLAALAVDAGHVVPTDVLADRMWSGEPAPQATATIHAYVSRLRSALRTFDAEGREQPSPLRTQPPGYVLDVPRDRIDADVFADLVARARAESEPQQARALVGEALGLWRGAAAYLDVTAGFAAREADRLRELRLSAVELSVRLDLELGRHAALVDELGALLVAEPLREGLHAALMLALYRSGRQGEALQHFEDVRHLLADELGIDPGPELRRLHEQILRQDEELAAPPTTAARPTAAGEPAPPTEELTGATRIVGRADELRRLVAAAERARSGTATTVAVVGEAGIGKSRLLEELAARAAGTGTLVAWGHCWQHEGAPVLWPWVQALEALADRLEPAEVERALAGRGAGVAALVPRLGSAVTGTPSSLDGARVQLYDAVAGFLEVVARERPVLLLLEDVHWADRASRELVEYVATAVRQAPLAVVVSVRTHAESSALVGTELLTALARTGRAERLDLTGLDEAAVREYVVDRTGSVLDDATAGALTDRTGGNPFFVGELVRLLVTDASDDGEPVLPDTVPDSVRDVVLRRVERLPEADRTVLTVAAVVGRTFDLGLLAAAAGLDDEVVDEAVDRATALDIIRSDPGGLSRHRFVHALTQQALLEATGPARLRRLHGAVAAALGEREPERTAYHLAAAGSAADLERAVTLLTGVAEEAWRRGNLTETEAVLLRALELTFRLGAESGPAEMAVRVRLWSLYAATEGPGSPRETAQHEQAVRLVREHGGARDLLAAHQARLAYLLWIDDVVDLAQLVEEMERVAEGADDDLFRLAAAIARGHLLHLTGRLADSAAAWDRADALSEHVEVPVGVFPLDPRCQVPTWQAHVALQRDDAAAAQAHHARSLGRLPAMGPTTRAYIANTSALLCALGDDPEGAARFAAASRGPSLDLGLTQSLKHLDVVEAWARERLAPGTALDEVTAAIERAGAAPALAMRPTLRSLTVDVLLRAGDRDRARTQLDAAFADVEATGDVAHLAELHRQRALLTGDPAELDRAREVAAEQGALLFARRADATRL